MINVRWLSALLAGLLTACALPNTAPASVPTAPPPTLIAATLAPPTAAPPTLAAQATSAAPTSAAPTALNTTASTTLPTAAPDAALDDPQRLAGSSAETRDSIALAATFRGLGAVPTAVRTTPPDVNVGDKQSFWVKDSINNTNYQITTTLRYAGPIALLYIDDRVDVDQAAVDQSGRTFEQDIYPRDRALFGSERSPGVDGDPRITIVTTPLRGAGGYFSATDAIPKTVNRFSNERDMFLIGAKPGTQTFESTLAHEFQHMIEWNQQRRSPTWFNEGMSTLAEDLNGFVNQGSVGLALARPDVQLTTWSSDAAQTSEHYGTARLFMRYFNEQYAQERGLSELIAADAGNNTEVFAQIAARRRPDVHSFADVVADWLVANAVNNAALDGGRYAYTLLPQTIQPQALGTGEVSDSVHQFGADYLALPAGTTLSFDGSTTVSTVGATPQSGRYAWWSNRGDNRVQTLTRAVDLRNVQQATLQFSLWHELELDYDYGLVTVSTDGGTTWTALKGNTTTADDPQGDNYGEAFTGVSGAAQDVQPDKGTRGQWIDEQMDLSAYAGKQIMLRFWAINDDAYNAAGMMIDNIRIPELNYTDDAEQGDADWQAQGFARITGEMAQTWSLRLVRQSAAETRVEPVPVDSSGHAQLQLAPSETGILMVMGSTPVTTEQAQYRYAAR